MSRRSILINALTLAVPLFLAAADTGKITGIVTDAISGEPLIGVNVLVSGSDLGGATDTGGRYIILQVPPGEYTLVASYIGYTTTQVNQVMIQTKLTTTININLAPSVLEAGEVVTVTATRPLVQLDETSSRRTITSTQLADLPIQSIEAAVALTAGAVVDAGGSLHLRGGRAQEVVYMLDGISLNDPLTGNPNDTDVPIFAAEETSVITGGFGAEYGNAQSGVINITTKEGGDNFSGRFRYSTSNGAPGDASSAHPRNIGRTEFSFSGPIIQRRMNFHIAGEMVEDFGRFDNQHSQLGNYIGKLTLKLTDKLKLNVSGLYSLSDYENGYSFLWSHNIAEDRLTGNIPSYIRGYDGQINGYKDGILAADEIPSYYTDWWSTDGLQTEDLDGDGVLDLYYETEPYADWNGNGQWDEGEWYDDLNGNGQYSETISLDMDGDGDNVHEDFNNNNQLDSEEIYDHWYGNSQLDTEDVNGNGILDPGEDLNGNGFLDTEDVDRNQRLTNFRMFDRVPLWRAQSDRVTVELRHTLSPRTYYTITVAQYHTELTSNVIERLNEDTDMDGILDVYWATEQFEDLNGDGAWNAGEWFGDINGDGVYNLDLDWDVDGDGDRRNEDLNGNGILDSYTPDKELTNVRDPQDMFTDWDDNGYVDQSQRDWDGNGVEDEYDRDYFWMPWDAIPSEGFTHTTGGFYGVGAGHPATFNRDLWHRDSKDITTIKGDFVSQVNHTHKFSAGFESIKYDIFNYDPPDRYGYAEKYKVKPSEWAAYLTDKMEFAGLVVSAGVRVQQFHPEQNFPGDEPYVDGNNNNEYDIGESFTDLDGNGRWNSGESDPTWTSNDFADWNGDGNPQQYKLYEDLSGVYIHQIDDLKNPVKAKQKSYFMPRLGISHRITDRAMLYFNYGKYFQRPAMSYIFRNINYDMGGGFPIVGNPGLDPELTTSYEMGVRYEFIPGFLFEATGFYKDIYGLTDTRAIYWSVSDWYTTYYNRDFGNVRGFEFILLRRPPGIVTGELNYTYSISKGKSSGVGQGYLTEWSGNIEPTFESYLTWDQTHMLIANIIVGLGPVRTSFVFNYGSGTRYTRPEQGRVVIENTEQFPSRFSSDMRMSYNLGFRGASASVFMLVTNLFNIRNIRGSSNLIDVQWYHTYKGIMEQYENGDLTRNEYMQLMDLDHDGKEDPNKLNPERGAFGSPSVYSPARRVQIGMSFSF